MECLHRSPDRGKDARVARYDDEKIAKIREKISMVFGRASTWDDVIISERYNLTPEGDLVMIIK
ncbi:MAG: hypothetical protein WC586_02940 [Methanoregula sp.]